MKRRRNDDWLRATAAKVGLTFEQARRWEDHAWLSDAAGKWGVSVEDAERTVAAMQARVSRHHEGLEDEDVTRLFEQYLLLCEQLGELAFRIEPRRGSRTLQRFAGAIGFRYSELLKERDRYAEETRLGRAGIKV